MKKFLATGFAFLGLGLSACTKSSFNHGLTQVSEKEESIFSNRPQTIEKMVVVLKLKNPALLTSVSVKDGKKGVDQDLKKAILEEQEALVKELQNLSSDIQILYRYKMVLNAVAIVAPLKLLEKLRKLGSVAYAESEGQFGRPIVLNENRIGVKSIKDLNSVNFIGADKVHRLTTGAGNTPVDGTGIKVGVLDTGIDYTHSMMKGVGTAEAFKAINPAEKNPAFPNEKVVGGIDLVGTTYNAASANFKARIPVPDENPIDEGGHGTHVAGTIAGIGDNTQSYDGVAPQALLYSIKVFGAEGSTGDAVVIAGLEYAADPTGKGDPAEQLDVVNLSLGSSYGFPHILYNEAIANLSQGGTVVVASAGNSGPSDYIVGAPSVADDAISVAASIDHSEHNWKFPAVKFLTSSQGEILSEAVEAPIAKSIEEAGDVSGSLVFIGLAAQDLDEETIAKVKGKVAFIDRGVAPFSDKIKRAQNAGAIGVVVGNNQPGDPFKMGGNGKYNIPAIMISQALATNLKEELKKGEVVVRFKNTERIEKRELIDTITGFSSKGPRSFDGYIKPEISSPGANVISAAMGEGSKTVQMSGTSMAAPHIAGVMALLKQNHKNLSAQQLKSLLMGHAKSITDKDKNEYPISHQGAGRVQAYEAVLGQLTTEPQAISLGEINLASSKVVSAALTVRNISKETQNIAVGFRSRSKKISLISSAQAVIAAGESKTLSLRFRLDAAGAEDVIQELDGFVELKSEKDLVTVPVLAVAKKVSSLASLSPLKVLSGVEDAPGAVAEVTIKNNGVNTGDLMLFNLLGVDQRKKKTNDKNVNLSCDLQAAGYRIIERDTESGLQKYLQIAVKLYQPQTTWNMCEVSVLIDKNGDQLPDQELAGVALSNVSGLAGPTNGGSFLSVLLDAEKARAIRKKYEEDSQTHADKATEDYKPAILGLSDMMFSNHSTVAVIESPVQLLAIASEGHLSIRIATITADDSSAQTDDFLDKKADQWTSISLEEQSQGFRGMPEKISLLAGESKEITLTKGFGKHSLLVLYPQNANVFSDLVKDGQAEILKPTFQ